MRENVHGTALLIGTVGILIRGPAQSGKTSLCISLLRRAGSISLNAYLVADDRVDLETRDAGIIMTAPEAIKGLMEISGIGILREETVETAPLSLIVDLVTAENRTRMPEKRDQRETVLGRSVRRIELPKQDAAFSADVVLTLLRSAYLGEG
ncbi:HPr kinase/phosphorylase [Fulvimarina sp. MAC3]|uniref:HPr kinase/phosphorylase n=1 Tax=Fulvimarina sp. MAC3 TaxID=3148887 RepID=UPI0031FC6033